MKRLSLWAVALLSLVGSQVSALPQHAVSEDAKAESSVEHRVAVEPGIHKKPVHLHTINGRNRDAGRLDEAPAPGEGRQITVMSTAYCLRGLTARGTRVNYGTIAVDPRIIPMGSKVYIPGYGWGRALDTGGAIRGNIIDLWFPTSGQCFQWGNRKVTITVVDERRH